MTLIIGIVLFLVGLVLNSDWIREIGLAWLGAALQTVGKVMAVCGTLALIAAIYLYNKNGSFRIGEETMELAPEASVPALSELTA